MGIIGVRANNFKPLCAHFKLHAVNIDINCIFSFWPLLRALFAEYLYKHTDFLTQKRLVV